MIVTVWHAKDLKAEDRTFPDDFEEVAEVRLDESIELWPDADLAENAFMLTNSIDRPWWLNRWVKAKKQARSTSVGDVVVIDRRRLQAISAGWKEI